jgi:phosphopantetheinyl transferase
VPIFFQHQINEATRLGIWKIEETEEFFLSNVPLQKEVTHPHKRLQHLAGRFLLQFLFPDFPYELIRIADTHKPYLPAEQYHFSISHCGDYAAAIVSSSQRVGIDIEIPAEKVVKIKEKFLSEEENSNFEIRISKMATQKLASLTVLWSAKESVFKWYGNGKVDFRQHIQLQKIHEGDGTINCLFTKTDRQLLIHYREFDRLVLAWVIS